MTFALPLSQVQIDTAQETLSPASCDHARLNAAIAAACGRIAPLWPLKNFVAVNPFLGFAANSFQETCAHFRRVARTEILMPRTFYRAAITAGEVTDEDLNAALAACTAPRKPSTLQALLSSAAADPVQQRPTGAIATIAEVLDTLAAGDRQASRTAFMVDEIGKFCAAYFDEGQAIWRSPFRDRPLYAAWRQAMRYDRNPETMGITGFRRAVAAAPEHPVEAIGAVLQALGIPDHAFEDYLHRALFDIGGWAAFVRGQVWRSELEGRPDDSLIQLLAIRVVWGYALFLERRDEPFRRAWAEAMAAATAPRPACSPGDADLAIDLILQDAYERAFQRRMIDRLSSAPTSARTDGLRPSVQAVFCIDVRSEVFRRALETVSEDVETLGFAGFFGMPVAYRRLGQTQTTAQCPVLLKPTHLVCETVAGALPDEEQRLLTTATYRKSAAKAWKSFQQSAVSSFGFVEAAGVAFATRLAAGALGRMPPAEELARRNLEPRARRNAAIGLAPSLVEGQAAGVSPEDRIALAESALRGMSLTDGFARIVLLVGHGGATVNNPHGAGLDCGACGGHSGEANARLAATILNEPGVRAALREKGISIPEDTWFVAGLHNTTTDEVSLFDEGGLPHDAQPELARLKVALERAAHLARLERTHGLGLPASPEGAQRLIARSRDWSQVRPEWGLAGAAAFIAAPREATRGLDLAGRAFLHTYDWRSDKDFSVLELIMTAPMVVASWISLQYYASSVNNRAFGAGDKTLHNVTGLAGVLEGNSGDLRVGLPWQSVHDGERLVHEPVRLNVCIAAPLAAINTVIAEHPAIADLVDNGWLHLFALSDEGVPTHRYVSRQNWEIL